MTFDSPKTFSGGVRLEYCGKYDTSRNAAAISGGFDVFERSGHHYVVVNVTYAGAYKPFPDRNINLMYASLQDSFIES